MKKNDYANKILCLCKDYPKTLDFAHSWSFDALMLFTVNQLRDLYQFYLSKIWSNNLD